MVKDAELRQARWEVDGTEYCLQQMTSDDQLWRVTQMSVGDSRVMSGFHHWLSHKWECDPVAMLTPEQPVRFLGMEIHLGEGRDGGVSEVS